MHFFLRRPLYLRLLYVVVRVAIQWDLGSMGRRLEVSGFGVVAVVGWGLVVD